MANMFYAPVGNLVRVRSARHGGLCRVQYVPVEDVASIPPVNPATGTITQAGGIQLKAGKAWLDAQSPVRKGYRSETQTGEAGTFVQTSVSVSLPFASRALHLALDRMKYHRYLLLLERPDGVILLIGSLVNPVTLAASLQSGERAADTASNSLTFSWTSEDLPLIYEPA